MRKLFFLFLLAGPFLSHAQTKALVGGTLIDGYGGKPLQNSIIIIEGERIKAIGVVGQLQIPSGAEVISTEGMSVMPGLWDMHVHLYINGHSNYAHWDKKYLKAAKDIIMPASAHQLLMGGVTSARDLGGPLEASLSVRDRINKGELPGPTMYMSGPFIQHAPYPGTESFRWGVNGVADARAKVQQLAKAGVNCIKLIDQDDMTMDEVMAVVDEAHKNKLKVVGHSHRPEEIRRGMKAGVDCFEHTGLASAPEYPDDIMAMIKERTAKMSLGPLFWTPTVEGLYNFENVRDNPEHLDNTSWHLDLPDSIIKDIKQSIAKPGQLSYFQLNPIRKPTLERKVKQLKEAGVVLLIGTDSGIPMKFHSQSTWNELDVWVNKFGFDPMYTIRAATYWPSVAMGVDKDFGTVSEGKYADIIAVKGDVLRHIDLLQDVKIVVKKGKRYK
ncbi:MAG: amidohydrolase family protein [Cytophagales bacterium]|nr:amidohydrolase family protein [Cytophagales bacterium]MCA6366238.1 amidohydrolase family protein [Cytophagales bacterium]MCA6371921.1 amidohydrolase family protein [Cytophagales bacterium]MCA6376629.1 amidohydrolase family protein [Cytophagales bacterium]MCA6383669.1 amidohydrolase family protein [Cytophagales bacterium]